MKIITLFLFLGFGFTATAQITNIPDPLFEELLIEMEIDSDGIVNGQMATSDALAITTLEIYYPSYDYPSGYISDLTGIEAFTNLDSLTVNGTMINELNTSTLTNLKFLNCLDNQLSSLDLSNNPLLEALYLTYGGDVGPINYFSEIDLSNNPAIHTLEAYNIGYINLKNGNNNPDMYLLIPTFVMDSPPQEYGHTCIEVDNEVAAQNNEFPYSEWTIYHSYRTYSFSDDCSLSTENFAINKISIYPNPTTDVLNIENSEGTQLEKVQIFNISGKLVKEMTDFSSKSISLSSLEEGMYFIRITSGKNTYTKKIIVE